MTTPILRSPGIPIGLTGYVAGGGVQGATPDLDATVQRAAEMLRARYRRPVMIRFNSDRQSGGAWVQTHKVDSLRANAEIGICAARFTSRPGFHPRYPDWKLNTYGDEEYPHGEHLFVAAHIGAASIRKGSAADHARRRPDACDYCHLQQPSLDEALTYLEENAVLRRTYSLQPCK